MLLGLGFLGYIVYSFCQVQVIRRLPQYRYRPVLLKYGSPECPICMSEYNTEDEVQRTACQHLFHAKCLEQWLERCRAKPRCPECNSDPYRKLASYTI